MKGKYSDFSIDWNNSECIKITEHTDAGRAKTVLIGIKGYQSPPALGGRNERLYDQEIRRGQPLRSVEGVPGDHAS